MNPWWQAGVIYQIYPRSFYSANPGGVGDLAGIIEKLDYVASLHVDGIWISPFFQSPMDDFGYDISDYCAVDPLFGTLEDFDRLIHKAHSLGLKVIIDQVLSHSSDRHPWFQESRQSRQNSKADWYVWADPKPDGTPPNNWLSVFGGSAWTWDARRAQYYLHNFLSQQPDLNWHNPAVQEAMLQAMEFWLKRGVDGFRLDAINFLFQDPQLRDNPPRLRVAGERVVSVEAHNPYAFQWHHYDKSQPEVLAILQRIRTLLNRYGAVSLGEVGDDESLPLAASYVRGSEVLHLAYTFDLLGKDMSPSLIQTVVEEAEHHLKGSGWFAWAFNNHDVVRAVTRFGQNKANAECARLYLAVLLCLRGTAFIYQGEELGLTQAEIAFDDVQDPYGKTFWPEFKGRDGCRTPHPWHHEAPYGGFSQVKPWLPVVQDHVQCAVSLQQEDSQSVLTFYRAFIQWHQNHRSFFRGKIVFYHTDEAVLAFWRCTEAGRIFCVFNFSDETRTLALEPVLRSLDPPGANARLEGKVLTLPPYAWGILSEETQ